MRNRVTSLCDGGAGGSKLTFGFAMILEGLKNLREMLASMDYLAIQSLRDDASHSIEGLQG